MSAPNNEGIKLAPVRSISDFISDSKGYLPPAFSDMKRLSNRITSNLLYYQTNYFVVGTIIFTLFVMFAGALGLMTTVFTVMYALDRIPQLSSVKARYPISVGCCGLMDLVIVYSTFRCILLFTLSLGLPFVAWIAHASMRKRNIKNKIGNKVEQISGGNNTPMSIVLSAFGFENKDFDE